MDEEDCPSSETKSLNRIKNRRNEVFIGTVIERNQNNFRFDSTEILVSRFDTGRGGAKLITAESELGTLRQKQNANHFARRATNDSASSPPYSAEILKQFHFLTICDILS